MPRRFTRRDYASDFFASPDVQVGPGMNYHHDLTAYHAGGSPSLFVRIRVFPRCGQGVVKHETRSIKVDTMCSKVRPILSLVPGPTQDPALSVKLHKCSYNKEWKSMRMKQLLEAGTLGLPDSRRCFDDPPKAAISA